MKKITVARAMRAVKADGYLGFCLACGATAHGVESDARDYTCEECGQPKVYGAEEVLMMVG